MTPNLMEAWLRLMADALRGTTAAQEALRGLANLSTPDDYITWMTRYLPAGSADLGRANAEDWPEEWWRMVGLVPRHRYLDLLERHAALQRKYEDAQAEIRRLRGQRSASQPVGQAVNAWESAFQDMLQAQNRWVQAWGAAATPPAGAEADESGSAHAPGQDD